MPVPQIPKLAKIRIPNGSGKPHWVDFSAEIWRRGGNSLHVLAGPNRSGKTFVLDSLAMAIRRTNFERKPTDTTVDQNGVCAIFEAQCDKTMDVSLILDIDYLIKKAASIPLSTERRTQRFNAEKEVRLLCNEFFWENFEFLFEGGGVEKGDWLTSDEVRAGIFDQLEPSKIYLANPDNDFVSSLRRATGGDLFFSKSKKFERIDFCLKFPGDSDQYAYPNWSYGQRALFILLLQVFYGTNSILMVDEVENHLHPRFISHFFEEALRWCPQTIITSHHPHAIFSRHATTVHYMESELAANRDLSKVQELAPESSNRRTPLSRNIVQADSELSKIANVYRLFEGHDAMLLRLSQCTAASMSTVLLDSVRAVFAEEVKPASRSTKPDLQSEQLTKVLKRSMGKGQTIRVLDFGAGKGRTFLEISKIIPEGAPLEWYFWEPDDELRSELGEVVAETRNTVVVEDREAMLKGGEYDIVVISNVLHELNPTLIAEVLLEVGPVMKDEGTMCICELSPLLNPEKYAVSYTPEDLQKILRNIGWSTMSSELNIRSGSVRAYLVECHQRKLTEKKSDIKKAVESVWMEILERCCGNYQGKLEVTEADHLIGVLSDLTTIASIVSNQSGHWGGD